MSKKKSGNALKHGIYSQEVILPGEKPRDYALLRAGLYDEWKPEGPTEEELVERLALQLWKRRRLHMHLEATMQERMDSIEKRNQASSILRCLKEIAPDFQAAKDAEEVECMLNKHAKYREIITAWVPRDVSQDESKWGPAIAAHLAKLQVSDPVLGHAKIPVVVDLLDFELERKIVDRHEETIDRTITRLVNVKASKAMFSSLHKPAQQPFKLIRSEPTTAS